MSDQPGPLRYQPLGPEVHASASLVVPASGERFHFQERVEIGRDEPGRPLEPGLLLVPDPSVSRHHCVVTRRKSGRCFVRDESRNGTRLDGRRLAPRVETEWRPGQTIVVSDAWSFRLAVRGPARTAYDSSGDMNTIPHTQRFIATVLVGDISDYTGMVREGLSEGLQRSVHRLYEALSAEVAAHAGTVKEYQGDAILAFWEGDATGVQAVRACQAALALDRLARTLARDAKVWTVPELPLSMDWALSTGLVLLDSFGASGPGGLSMMGEPVVRAFRMEKFADASTGRILACRATREAAGEAFAWRDLGERTSKGFDRPDRIFAVEPLPGGA